MDSQSKPSETAVIPRQQSGALALLAGGRAETAKALARAINACHPVEKSSVNEYHKYKYASADNIIEEGRRALASAGLVLVPIESTVDGFQREGPDRFELVRVFALLHESGEITPIKVCWPITPEKGRPLDKATAIADTLSLSYLLRDLLLMNRVDPSDDLNTRDDRQQPQKQRAKPEKPLPVNGKELLEKMQEFEVKLVNEGVCKPGDLIAAVQQRGMQASYPGSIFQWNTVDQIRSARLWGKECAEQFRKVKVAAQANGKSHTSPPAAASTPTVADRVKELEKLLEKKRIPWDKPNGLRKYLKLPETARLEDLSPELYARAVKIANEVPE